MSKHLIEDHKAPSSLRLQTTDTPPDDLSLGPFSSLAPPTTPLTSIATTTINAPTWLASSEPAHDPGGPSRSSQPSTPSKPTFWDGTLTPGAQLPPESPDPGPTPSRKAFVSDDDEEDDNPFASAHHPRTTSLCTDSSFEDDEVRHLLTPNRPLFVRAESLPNAAPILVDTDIDDIYEPEVLPAPILVDANDNISEPPPATSNPSPPPPRQGVSPSPPRLRSRSRRSEAASSQVDIGNAHRDDGGAFQPHASSSPPPRLLRSSSRRSQTAATSQVDDSSHHNSDADDMERDTDDDDAQVDPVKEMLEDAGLFVIPVDDQISVLACIACQKGIKPSNALSHAKKKPHKLRISKERQGEIVAWIRNAGDTLADHTKDLPKVLPQGEKPVEGLPVQKGLSCTECTYCCRTQKSYDSHWSDKHRNNNTSAAEDCEVADVQTHFKYCPKYFAVNLVLRGTNARSIIRLYVNQYSKAVASFNSDAIPPPISQLEVPPLLQETQWHAHLRRFLDSKKKVRTLRRLVQLPRGKAAWEDPLGDTLREAIVLYMKNIRKKGLDSPLDVRGILTSAPTEGPSDPWRPLLTEKSLQDYARFLHKYVYALLLTKSGTHTSNYHFNLTENEKHLADKLVDLLRKKWTEDHTDEGSGGQEDGHEGGSDAEDADKSEGESEGGEDGEDEGDEDGEDERDEDEGGEDGEEEDDEDEEDEDEEDEEDIGDGEEDELSNDDLDLMFKADSDSESYDSELVQVVHDFVRSIIYPRARTETTLHHTPSKWDDPIERFIAVYCLQPDGNFRHARLTTQIFAMFHYHIRGAVLYEGYLRLDEFEGDIYKAVMDEALKNFQPGSRSPYVICRDYQRLASSIAMSSNSPPTTVVGDDGMSISFREHTLAIPAWRTGLAKLAADVEQELDSLCGDIQLTIPSVVPDDWTNETRGYSWTTNDPNRFGLQNDNPLFYRLLKDRRLGQTVNGVLLLNKPAMETLLDRCDLVCEKIFLLVYLTPSASPRISEMADYKHGNSTRGRNMFHHDHAIWFLNRRVKYESLLRKESSIASKASPQVTKFLEKYFLLVRPLEKELVYHLFEGDDQKRAYQLYCEYMWMKSGTKRTAKDLSRSLLSFMEEECGAKIGPRIYRQICVEIGRVFLGSEAAIEAEERDILSSQMAHSVQIARSNYALEVGRLPGMPSDLLLRYSRISELWWSVIGFNTGSSPLEPLKVRQKLAAATAVQHQKALQKLLDMVETLRNEVQRLENQLTN